MSFFNPSQTMGQQQQQPSQPQQQSTGGFGNQFSSPGPLSFNDLNKNSQQQQQQPAGGGGGGGLFGQQSQSGPSGSLFGNSSFGNQPQAQQQPRPQQPQSGFGGGGLFGVNPGAATNQGMGGGLFGSQNKGQPQPQQVQASQQPNQFGQPLQGQPQQQGAPLQFGQSQFGGGGAGTFGQQLPFGAQQQPQQQHQQQQAQVQQPFLQSQSSPAQQYDQQRLSLQQQQPQSQLHQQQMSYMPGYLSRMRGEKPYRSPARQLEPGSPERAEADASSGFGTPASKSAKDDSSSSRNQSSPVGRFSSSFFNQRRDDSDGLSRSGSVGPGAWRGGRESIFGAGGLRGGRKSMTPAPSSGGGAGGFGGSNAPETPGSRLAAGDSSFSPSRSFRAATSPPGRSSSFAAGIDDDDNDAPPPEMLDDIRTSSPSSSMYGNGAAATFSSFGAGLHRGASIDGARNGVNAGASGVGGGAGVGGGSATPSGSTSAADQPLTGRAAQIDRAQRTILIYGYPYWMEKAVLELFAAMGTVELIESIDITGSGSAQDQAHSNPSGPLLPCCTRLVYEASFQALHALRRNGEIVAGACVVGVRWEDENFHQIAQTGGMDAVFRRDVVPSARTREVFKAGARALSIPSVAVSVAGQGGGSGLYVDSQPPQQQQRPSSPSSTGALVGMGTNSTAGGGTAAGGTAAFPSYGRPISVVSGGSAIRPASNASAGSPFRVAGSLFGGGAAGTAGRPAGSTETGTGTEKEKGVMGRIADGIFGW